MAQQSKTDTSPLESLPFELIAEITLWAQLIWQREALSIHAPRGGVQRFTVAPPQVPVRHEECCRNVGHRELSCCLRVSITDTARSPAHCLSQTSRRLRSFLIAPNVAIWTHDNILYKINAERSGILRRASIDNGGGSDDEATDVAAQPVTPGPIIGYGARTLIVPSACACLMPVMRRYYPSLENVRVRTTWDTPSLALRNAEECFWRHHDGENSPLKHFDLEIFSCPRAPVRPVFRGVASRDIQTSRTFNACFFFFSNSLSSLYIYMPFGRSPRFGTSFWEGLAACAERLEYFTLDAGDGLVNGVAHIALPALRYLRVVLPAREGSWFLRALLLPPTLDLHLEPVVAWRRLAVQELESTLVHEVPFAAIERKVEAGLRPASLWRYTSVLAAPEATSGAFQDPPEVFVRTQSLWHNMTTAALDIRLDPSTAASERSCSRFPEYVSIALTDSYEEMLGLLADDGRDWQHSPPPAQKTAARRSLSVRDEQFDGANRNRLFEAQLVKPVYDSIQYLVNQAVAGPFTSNCLIVRVMFHAASYLPDFSIGWQCTLEDFKFMEDLHLLPPLLVGDDSAYSANVGGCTAPVHLEALAMYLNDIRDPLKCPSSLLKRIHLRSPSHHRGALPALASELETRFNTNVRLNTGVPAIVFVISIA